MKSIPLTYEADGLRMVGELNLPDTTEVRPGILVFPEAFGLGDHAKSKARRLAESGYVALACDLHGEQVVHPDLAAISPILEELRNDPARLQARAGNALLALRGRAEVDTNRIGAIGFCFGGTMALELVRGGQDIAAAVGFHSGLSAILKPKEPYSNAKILALIGADDPGIPSGQRIAFEEEMRAAGIDWQLHVYGGVVHSFTNPDAVKIGMPEFARYDAAADARSWATMQAFLSEVFALG